MGVSPIIGGGSSSQIQTLSAPNRNVPITRSECCCANLDKILATLTKQLAGLTLETVLLSCVDLGWLQGFIFVVFGFAVSPC